MQTLVYQYIYNNSIDFYIELYEDFPCESRIDLYFQEGLVIKDFKSKGINLMNMVIPGRTRQEYYYDNQEYILEKVREYQIKNYEKLTALTTCSDCQGTYTYWNWGSHKKSASHRKAIGLEPLTFDCECGAKGLDILNKHHHLKTYNHLKYLGRESEYVNQEKPGMYKCACGSEIWNQPSKIKRHEAGDKHKFLMLPEDERNRIMAEKQRIRKEKYNETQNRCYHARQAMKKQPEEELSE
jgi:hypothetical protein